MVQGDFENNANIYEGQWSNDSLHTAFTPYFVRVPDLVGLIPPYTPVHPAQITGGVQSPANFSSIKEKNWSKEIFLFQATKGVFQVTTVDSSVVNFLAKTSPVLSGAKSK